MSARKLMEIVKELPGGAAGHPRAGQRVGRPASAGARRTSSSASPPDDFPAVGAAETAAWISLDGKVLRDMLAQTSFAISHDESRYALNGVLFTISGKELRLVATDGHRLALATRPLVERRAGTCPGSFRARPSRRSPASWAPARRSQVSVSDNQFVLQMPNTLLMARLIEGTFPNYEQVVPKAHPPRLTVAKAALTAALRRVSVLSEERTKPVKFDSLTGDAEARALTTRISARPEESSRSSTPATRSPSGSIRAIVLDALGRPDRRASRARSEGRNEPRSGQELRGGGSRCVLSCPCEFRTSGRSEFRVHIEWIVLSDFRSYPTLSYSPTPNLNVITGPNGQGKTNLLEGLGLLLVGRSFRGSRAGWNSRAGTRRRRRGAGRDPPRRRHARDPANDRRPRRRRLGRDGRRMSVGARYPLRLAGSGDRQRRAAGAARLPGRVRRQDLSGACRDATGRYRRVLERRNHLLQSRLGLATLDAALEPWDEQLARVGLELLARRRQALEAASRPRCERSILRWRETAW